METRSVAFSREITEHTLKGFVLGELGGRWDSEPGLEQGVVESQRAIVYVSVESADDLEPEEAGELRVRLGTQPVSLVMIRVGRAPGSTELAGYVLDRVKDEWAGAVVP